MSNKYTVRAGDCLSSIAAEYGFDDWRAIYDAPANETFRKKRPNPNLIYPGDTLVIPDAKPRKVNRPTGATHVIAVRRERTWLRLQLKVHEPHKYLLEVGAQQYAGVTDGSDVIAHRIDARQNSGTLRYWPVANAQGSATSDEATEGSPSTEPPDDALVWTLSIGSLDPIEEVSGIQGRPRNLGYFAGEITGDVDEPTQGAIRRFRVDQQLSETSDIDQVLRDKLVQLHDQP
jgi:hypothetical protein